MIISSRVTRLVFSLEILLKIFEFKKMILNESFHVGLIDDTFIISDGDCSKEGICYVGQLNSVGSLKVLNWKECQMRCGADYQCQQWTFLEGTKMCTKISMKYVKMFDMLGCVSGPKHCDGKSKLVKVQRCGLLLHTYFINRIRSSQV